jgi:hypothetical protein
MSELSSELNGELFTRHGMHLNKRGKAEIAKHITEACKLIVQPKKKSSQFPYLGRKSEIIKLIYKLTTIET